MEDREQWGYDFKYANEGLIKKMPFEQTQDKETSLMTAVFGKRI